jgi:hypothetical protein
MATRDYNISGFSRVSVKFALEADIIRSDQFKVTISGSDSLIENAEVYQEGDRLVVGYHLNFLSFLTAPFSHGVVTIYMPEIRELQITGAARSHLKGFSSDKEFALQVSGASQVDFADFAAGSMRWELSGASQIRGQIKLGGDADIRTSGASHITLKGEVRDISVDATGASQIDMRDFMTRNARVRMSGASHYHLNMNGKLDVDLSGASTLEYQGNVTMGDVRVSGGSNLRKR